MLRAFAHHSSGITIELYLDSTAAVAYINNGGGTLSRRLSSRALELLAWCEARRITIRAVHLPGVRNTVADLESRRVPDSSDWMLNPMVFSRIADVWKVDMDLFAFAWNAHLPSFASWLPQPGAAAVNAFSLSWSSMCAYLFPPFALIPRCLTKIRRDEAEVVFICPYWPSRPYFPMLLELSVDSPRLLPFTRDLLMSCTGQPHPLTAAGQLRLIAWRLSGRVSAGRIYRDELLTYCSIATAAPPTKLTNLPGRAGVLGVWNGMPIPYVPL